MDQKEEIVRRLLEAWNERDADASSGRSSAIHLRGDEAVVEARIFQTMPDSPARMEVKTLLKFVFEGHLVKRLEALGAGSDFDEALEAAGLDDD